MWVKKVLLEIQNQLQGPVWHTAILHYKDFPLANYTIGEVQNIYVRSTVLSPETQFHIFTYQLRLKIEFWKEE